MGSGDAVVKGGTFQVRAEGRAGVGQAEREQFVQMEGAHGTLGESRAVLSGWRIECSEEEQSGWGTCRNRQGHIVQDLRGPWCSFLEQKAGLALKVRATLGGYPGCVLHKGAS